MIYEVELDLGWLGHITGTVEACREKYEAEYNDADVIRLGSATLMVDLGDGDVDVSALLSDVFWDNVADQVQVAINDAQDGW